MSDGTPPPLDPTLTAMIERMVDARVDARLAGFSAQVEEALARLRAQEGPQRDQASILVFSGDFDRLISAFIIATGAVAMGIEVSMYFTFWGLVALKKQTTFAGKTIEEKMLSAMLPGGPANTGTSKMNMLGMGPIMFKRVMAQNNVETLPGLIKLAQDLGVKLIACRMAMGVMGIKDEELIDGVQYGGVATYLGDAIESKITLFI
ncbi:DsrE/DsrF/DrsH-like family protein [Nannocystis sp.]|uniref:DsrE/DsrF/DrsH-like family protein n=1 Tax=Nannocystis sp. TaxID=1962667 RepID=UPI0025DBE5E3|nr:DsrE/DsrF/DrsH-like family protein [Nannocystis sp.]